MTATTLKDQALDTTARLASKVITATRDMTAASGDVAYTGVGFKPTSIIACSAVDASTKGISWGFCDSAKTNRAMAYGNTTATFYASLTALVYFVPSDGNYQIAIVKSFDADGFTLTWAKTSSPTGTLNMQFLCFR